MRIFACGRRWTVMGNALLAELEPWLISYIVDEVLERVGLGVVIET